MTAAFAAPSTERGRVEEVDPAEEERRWAQRAAEGDMRAFRCIYDRYLPKVLRHVTRILGPTADVEDVVQEVFVQMHRSLPSFRGESRLSTWTYRLTWNVAISHRRRRRKVVDLSAVRALRLSTEDWKRLEARDLCRTLGAALEGVSDDAREAFLLVDVEGMKLREVAELTDTSINTVAARVRRTRDKLREALNNADDIRAREDANDCG